MPRLIFFMLLLPVGAFSQIWAGFSGGYSFTTVNPPEKFGFEQSSSVDSTRGRDFAMSFTSDITEKIRLTGRMTYNHGSMYVFHRYIEAQGLENQIDGRLEHQYLGIYLAPMWHKGENLEFVYGLGFYTGFKMSGTFSGVYRTLTDRETDIVKVNKAPADNFNGMATGLYTSVGFNLKIRPKLQANLNADVILFLNAKNIIFQDTGSVNEINFRLGLSYLFEKRED